MKRPKGVLVEHAGVDGEMNCIAMYSFTDGNGFAFAKRAVVLVEVDNEGWLTPKLIHGDDLELKVDLDELNMKIVPTLPEGQKYLEILFAWLGARLFLKD